MKEQTETLNLDYHKEEDVNSMLKKHGFYDRSHNFPIASLEFELTSHCNLACKHCYNNSGIANVPDRMSGKEWINFSKYLVERGGLFECILSGGEPLILGNDLFRIMDILDENDTLFFLISNGYLLTNEVVKKLKKYRYHKIQISIDGVTAEYHDSFRQRKGSWENAVNGARAIANTNIPLKIAHCVTSYNIADIDQMCDFAYSIGASSIMVGELCLSGRAALNQNLLLSNDQREILYQKVKENLIKFKGLMKVKCSHLVIEGLIRHSKAPNSCAIIRPNGDIRIDGMAPFVVGNILRDNFEEVWKNKLFDAWQNPSVLKFLSEFDEDDRNNTSVNYIMNDIYL